MRIDVITIFPEFFGSPLRTSLLGKAVERGTVAVNVHDLRDHATDKHRTVDDEPFGGGAGMVMKPGPWFAAVEAIDGWEQARRILLTPAGRRLDHGLAVSLAATPHLILMCGRYEGIDERVAMLATDEVSIGDFVLAGGESAALIVIEAATRLVPGVVKEQASVEEDSFATGLLDYPHYTRPASFRGMAVPDVLLSGDHGRIERWRRDEALRRTKARRPDLLPPGEDG
ncbi:MAG TPA: tRNA (guanosine(37)-N1)-methyltransferase TrmD [Actinomycetota bacterium]|nr:tRNA (guanosine(37)-N1)-methyltransferase TrmD [Actinomycetota bacterium]